MLRWPELPFSNSARSGPPGSQQPCWCGYHTHVIWMSPPERSAMALEVRRYCL